MVVMVRAELNLGRFCALHLTYLVHFLVSQEFLECRPAPLSDGCLSQSPHLGNTCCWVALCPFLVFLP